VAARIRQLAREAEHRRAIAEFRARRAADPSQPDSTPCCSKQSPSSPASSASPATQASSPPAITLPEREHQKLPTHTQTAWPLTRGIQANLGLAGAKAVLAKFEIFFSQPPVMPLKLCNFPVWRLERGRY